MKKEKKNVVNLVTHVAQALEMAQSELKRKREDSIKGGECKTATMDWNALRINSKQLQDMLLDYY